MTFIFRYLFIKVKVEFYGKRKFDVARIGEFEINVKPYLLDMEREDKHGQGELSLR